MPRLDRPRGHPIDPIPGSPPDMTGPRTGCAFAPRCRFAQARCTREQPSLQHLHEEHRSACWEIAALQVAESA